MSGKNAAASGDASGARVTATQMTVQLACKAKFYNTHAEAGEAPPAPVPLNNLPRMVAAFAGRVAEEGEIVEALTCEGGGAAAISATPTSFSARDKRRSSTTSSD
jgi:hypothetical protein